ncbi:MAG: hypothetical protein ABSG31_05830 [Tepidisphaeraceae bacterium]|jgi:hypothetical protein
MYARSHSIDDDLEWHGKSVSVVVVSTQGKLGFELWDSHKLALSRQHVTVLVAGVFRDQLQYPTFSMSAPYFLICVIFALMPGIWFYWQIRRRKSTSVLIPN